MSFPYILQGNNISVVIGSKVHTVTSSHVLFNQLREAIRTGDWDRVQEIIEPKAAVMNYGRGKVTIQGSELFWDGVRMHNALTTKMINMLREGFDVEPMVCFMDNLMDNPSKRAVDELYGFLEKGNLPITPDGYILAFKKVRDTWFDVHSGRVLNKPAHLMTAEDLEWIKKPTGVQANVRVTIENGVTVVSMPRNSVDDRAANTCSDGLHFCSQDYLKNFGGSRVLIVKINPRDVVSIPADYNDTKARCCRYEIVGELGAEERPEEALSEPVKEMNTPRAQVKSQPVTGPKIGNSDFYRGYSAGYSDKSNKEAYDDWDHEEEGYNTDYEEGYRKGWDDCEAGQSERYVYVA